MVLKLSLNGKTPRQEAIAALNARRAKLREDDP